MNPAIYQQQHDHTCGAACVRMVMDHFGRVPLSERTLAKKLHAKFETGIEPFEIERYLISEGFRAEYRQEKTFRKLIERWSDGWSPIICWSDWGGHYVILMGIINPGVRQCDQAVVLADSAAKYDGRPDGYTQTSVDRFKSMWFNPLGKEKREVIYVRE